MNRRVLSTAAATAAIILAPTAAMAYTGDDDYDAAGPGSVAQGVPFDVTLEGPNENALFGLTIASANVPDSAIEIAGSQTLEKATVDGVSVFEVTLNEEAVYEVTGTNAAGDVVLESEIVVGDAVAGDDAADEDAADDDAAAGGELPDTGSSSTPLVIGAAALLAAGAGVLVFARRQQA
jgi:LPXTG-motif cell wall-anchored protein